MSPNCIYFPDQWDLKSPWHDLRVRQAASLALDRDGMNEALFLGYCKKLPTASFPIVSIFTGSRRLPFTILQRPRNCWRTPATRTALMPVCFIATAPTRISAKRQSTACSRFRTRLEPIERAGFIAAYSGKKLSRGILRGASGAFGNAATRLAAFVVSGGSYVYGSYPDIDELYSQQADELDQTKRATILAKMQQLVYEKAIYVPLRQLAFINGVGPRVGQSGSFPDSPTLPPSRTSRSRHITTLGATAWRRATLA